MTLPGSFFANAKPFNAAAASLGVEAIAAPVHDRTRDIRRLSGLWRLIPITATLAMVAAAAMAGVPLLNGFLSKEMRPAWRRDPPRRSRRSHLTRQGRLPFLADSAVRSGISSRAALYARSWPEVARGPRASTQNAISCAKRDKRVGFARTGLGARGAPSVASYRNACSWPAAGRPGALEVSSGRPASARPAVPLRALRPLCRHFRSRLRRCGRAMALFPTTATRGSDSAIDLL